MKLKRAVQRHLSQLGFTSIQIQEHGHETHRFHWFFDR
jgi:hypothetical protein